MGKQNRRKGRYSKKNKSSSASKTKDNHHDDSSSATNTNSSTLLVKIRHSDPRTRHAALTALSATLLNPQSLSRQQQKQRKVTTELLQAVRERIMDADLECSQAAAGCVANFCNFCQQSNKNEITAGWTVVLVGRLQQCRDALLMAANTAAATGTAAEHHKNPKKKSLSSSKQWWAVTAQCLHALCALVESNPEALDRLIPSAGGSITTSTQEHCIGTLLDLLSVGQSQLENANPHEQQQQQQQQQQQSTAVVAAAASLKRGQQQQQQEQEEYKELISYIQDATIYSVRTLHSALDDNYELLQPWLQKNEAVSMEGLKLLASCCYSSSSPDKSGSHSIPPAAKLHAAGCLVTARQLVVLQQQQQPQSGGGNAPLFLNLLQSQVVEFVIPMLHNLVKDYSTTFFSSSSSTISSSKCQELLTTLCVAQQQFQQEMADDAMEREIIQKVSRRKEPARFIARRQKLDKERKEKEEAAAKQEQKDREDQINNDDDNGDDAMMQEDDQEEHGNRKKKLPSERQNIREIMEQSRKAWHDTLLPLQLALEISANLTSIVPIEDGFGMGSGDNDDAMMMEDDEWGPDQEAQLLASAGQEEEAPQLSSHDTVLVEKLVAQKLPDSLVTLLHHACTPIVITGHGNDNDDRMNESTVTNLVIPPDVQHDLMDIQSKSGNCIGNCLANLLPWKSSDPLSVWRELRHSSENLMENINSTNTNSYDGMEGIVNAMVVALQTRPPLRSQMQEGDLDFLLSFLMMKNNSNIKPTLQRDAACALGILCSTEVHPAQVNTKVCTALTTCCFNTKSAMVLSEILNSLMDMYGDDDTHPQVFQALNVLVCFQKTVPLLKKQILVEKTEASPEDVEQWKEIVLNASRFIQYKKGQL